jgi:hypothetical protein
MEKILRHQRKQFFKRRLCTAHTRSRHLTPGAASRPSSGERDKIVLAHPLQDQKYG